jgi:RNA polymerase sigma factor (sigma-70 family)
VETARERMMMAIVKQATRERDASTAWANIVRRYAPYVHAVLVRAYRLPERDAEEVFQEVFARVWERMDELRDDSSLRACIATRACQLAREAREKLADDVAPPSTPVLRELDRALAVQEAFARLPPTQWAVATRHWVEGQDHSSIATALGMPVESVVAHLERTRRDLEHLLQHEAPDATRTTQTC